MMIDFIIINTAEDTKDFECLTHGFEEVGNILINPSKSAVRRLLRSSTNDLVLFGHGDENGLYNVRMDGYIIGSKDVDLLRKRNVIGIWCYAGNFADKYGLHGFFTSMFISNINEAIVLNFDAAQEEIKSENIKFAVSINALLRRQIPYSDWVMNLQEIASFSDLPFVHYNYEALAFYE